MTREQELKVTKQIKYEMTRVRNEAIVTGMKSALGVVLSMCEKDVSDEEKIKEIKEFCDKGINNGK